MSGQFGAFILGHSCPRGLCGAQITTAMRRRQIAAMRRARAQVAERGLLLDRIAEFFRSLAIIGKGGARPVGSGRALKSRNERALSRRAQTEVTRLLPGQGSAGCGGVTRVSGCNREPTTDQALGRCYQPRRRGGKPQRRRAATVRLPQYLGKLDRCGAARKVAPATRADAAAASKPRRDGAAGRAGTGRGAGLVVSGGNNGGGTRAAVLSLSALGIWKLLPGVRPDGTLARLGRPILLPLPRTHAITWLQRKHHVL
jgi:hypothetical protein